MSKKFRRRFGVRLDHGTPRLATGIIQPQGIFYFRNILSIRRVTAKPPVILTLVMAMAIAARIQTIDEDEET